MKTIRARYDGRAFVPEEPVDLPVGFTLEIPLAAPSNGEQVVPPLMQLVDKLKALPTNPDWPADGAAQHDHYLYGTPKKT